MISRRQLKNLALTWDLDALVLPLNGLRIRPHDAGPPRQRWHQSMPHILRDTNACIQTLRVAIQAKVDIVLKSNDKNRDQEVRHVMGLFATIVNSM